MRVWKRDAEIVAWLGGIGAAGAEHVAQRFEVTTSLAYFRLAPLIEDGMLEHRRVLHGRPGVYFATKKGLRWQGLSALPVFDPSPGGFEHAWWMASVAVALHRGLPGWELIAEREMRLLREERNLVVWAKLPNIGARPAYHRPDFALISPSGRVVVVEVELSPKEVRRLTAICRGWARARHVEHVYYLASPRAARPVRRVREIMGATDLITVLELEDVSGVVERERERTGVFGPVQAPDGLSA